VLHSSGSFSGKSMYASLINNGVRVSQDIWQIKVPTKIKIFLWYLKKGVILTKDNLVRRHWNGDTKCCFCHSSETIQHLFLYCLYAKFLWRAVHLLFGIAPPRSIDDLFNRWPKRTNKKHNALLLTEASALCWAVWITRNEVVFEKCRPISFFCIYFSGELTGSGIGQDCSGVMIYGIS
jgi:hypothetical protein